MSSNYQSNQQTKQKTYLTFTWTTSYDGFLFQSFQILSYSPISDEVKIQIKLTTYLCDTWWRSSFWPWSSSIGWPLSIRWSPSIRWSLSIRWSSSIRWSLSIRWAWPTRAASAWRRLNHTYHHTYDHHQTHRTLHIRLAIRKSFVNEVNGKEIFLCQ